MTKENLVTSHVGTTLMQAKQILMQHKIEKLPLIDDDGYLRGLITIKDIEKSVQYPNSARDKGAEGSSARRQSAQRRMCWSALARWWRRRWMRWCLTPRMVTARIFSRRSAR